MERKKFVPREWLSIKNKERGGGGEVKIIALSPPPTPTVHSNANQTRAVGLTIARF